MIKCPQMSASQLWCSDQSQNESLHICHQKHLKYKTFVCCFQQLSLGHDRLFPLCSCLYLTGAFYKVSTQTWRALSSFQKNLNFFWYRSQKATRCWSETRAANDQLSSQGSLYITRALQAYFNATLWSLSFHSFLTYYTKLIGTYN